MCWPKAPPMAAWQRTHLIFQLSTCWVQPVFTIQLPHESMNPEDANDWQKRENPYNKQNETTFSTTFSMTKRSEKISWPASSGTTPHQKPRCWYHFYFASMSRKSTPSLPWRSWRNKLANSCFLLTLNLTIPTVDGWTHKQPPEMYQTHKSWDKLPINWWRIASINSSSKFTFSGTILARLNIFMSYRFA